MPGLSARIDPLLESLLPPISHDEARSVLSRLIAAHAEPVIKGIIRYKLHLSYHDASGQADADDLCQEAVLQLLAELQKFGYRPDAHPIGDFRGLAAVITYRACSRWMRRRFPERHALANRLHYLLTRQKGFALWQSARRKLIAGFAAWQGQNQAASEECFRQVSGDEKLLTEICASGGTQTRIGPAVAAIFNRLGCPLEFDKLVSLVAALLPVRERRTEPIDQGEDAMTFAAYPQPDPSWQLEKRVFLQRLWEEVRRLPLNQRTALLLNLKDADGGGCIALFPATGVASIRQLAETLDISAERLAELWNELPLPDSRIAELLNVRRQHVINARKSARERLTRRLKGFL